MKRVRLRIRPDTVSFHPGYELVTGGAEYLSTVEIVNWNVSTEPTGHLFRIDGDADATADALDEMSKVVGYDITTIDGNSFCAFVRSEATPVARQLMNTFTRQSLLVVPPVECRQDGTLVMTLAGSSAEIQAAIDGVPEEISVDIEKIGGDEVSRDAVAASLSDRQRTAISAGIEVGYYQLPRQAALADVASEMDCAPSTAWEHLTKAEIKLVTGIWSNE